MVLCLQCDTNKLQKVQTLLRGPKGVLGESQATQEKQKKIEQGEFRIDLI